MTKRLTLSFETRLDVASGDHYATLPVDPKRELMVIARSEGKARVALEQEIKLHVGKSLATERAGYNRLVIGTTDGHVLLLSWMHETSTYWIHVCGPDRTHSSSCAPSELNTAHAAREHMRQYARDCFGGVAWETRC